MNKSSGVSYLNTSDRHATKQDNSNQMAISKISQEVSRNLNEMLQSMFDGIDDSFFELANNARTNNEQNRFFEAMREIRIKRKGIESDFDSIINTLFSTRSVLKQKKGNDNATIHSGIDSLSLVQNEDLEEDVAISSMSSKARSNFQGPLLQFQARIGKLYGISELSEISPPLDPKDISKAFSEACANVEIQIKERLIVYKQFDRYVLSNLGLVLEGANKSLIRLGIMPSLKTPGIKQKHLPRSETASAPILKSNQPSLQNSEAEQPNILPHLQSLLANIRTLSTNTNTQHVDTAQIQLVDTRDLFSMLTEIQRNLPQNPKINGQTSVIDIQTALQKKLHKSTPQESKTAAFNQTDEDLINLVSMLFEFILDDYNLAPPIQVLISRLQIPILKVVIKDNSFFSSNHHPARQLLNSLAKAGIGWGELKNNSHDTLYEKIHDTVHRILNEYNGDTSLFKELNDDFNLFIKKEDRKSKLVEQRTKEAEEGLIKSKQAQKSVENCLNQLIVNARHPIPDLVIETLKSGWSRVMFLAFLKDEQEHQWLSTNKIAEDLIWCLQPLKAQKDRQKWITIAPKLLKALRSGLEDVSYKTSELDETIVNIRTALTNSFKNSSFEGSEGTTNKARNPINLQKKTSEKEKSAVEKQMELKDGQLDAYFSEIEALEIGTWLEFKLINGSKFRCKLSTKLPEADCFIFVNRMGLKTIEKTKVELAVELSKKQLIILEQGLMIDRAMNALTSTLKQKASA